jgi:hypothetical protein
MNKNTAGLAPIVEALRTVALTGHVRDVPKADRKELVDTGLIQRGSYGKSPDWMLTAFGVNVLDRDFVTTSVYKAWSAAVHLHGSMGDTLTGVCAYARDRAYFTPVADRAVVAAVEAHATLRDLASEAEARMVEALRERLLKENT